MENKRIDGIVIAGIFVMLCSIFQLVMFIYFDMSAHASIASYWFLSPVGLITFTFPTLLMFILGKEIVRRKHKVSQQVVFITVVSAILAIGVHMIGIGVGVCWIIYGISLYYFKPFKTKEQSGKSEDQRVVRWIFGVVALSLGLTCIFFGYICLQLLQGGDRVVPFVVLVLLPGIVGGFFIIKSIDRIFRK